MVRTPNYRYTHAEQYLALYILLLLTGAIALMLSNKLPPCHDSGSPKYALLALYRQGYDAKTGKWINKKPSPCAFAVTPEVYQEVKNWYVTDSGTNNPNHLPLMVPRYGYTYMYVPYKDSKHPNVTGMSMQGADGYKGYWYADDLSQATDSVDANGNTVNITPPESNTVMPLKYGGYSAETGKWISTSGPGADAFAVTPRTYQRVKNWYATHFGEDNPMNLTLLVPREGFTYLYVPYKDPKHPGVMGMSFQGDRSYKGYWYADKLPVADTATNSMATQSMGAPNR